ncbi:MAG: hypothetical protein ACYTF1_12405 [Planctomycetota bacterium]|jgi:hypothetical protein
MSRLFLFRFLACVIIAFIFGGLEVSATTTTLQELIDNNGTIQHGDKLFSNFNVSITGLGTYHADAAEIDVTGITLGHEYGLLFGEYAPLNPMIEAMSESYVDVAISFDVTVFNKPGFTVNDITLSFDGFAPIDGFSQVVETAYSGPVVVGQAQVETPSNMTSHIDLTPGFYTMIHVTKDIAVIGGSNSSSGVTFVEQTFSQIPEPTMLSLLGVGYMVFLCVRRKYRGRLFCSSVMVMGFATMAMNPGTASALLLQELVEGQSLTWHDKEFDNFSVQIEGEGVFFANASALEVRGLTLGDEHGLRITGLIAALDTGGVSSKVTVTIGYDVTVINPALGIDGVSLSFNGAITGNGSAQVIEGVSDGLGLNEQVEVSTPDRLSEHLDLPGTPYTILHITKTIKVNSGEGGVTTISVINQTFSQDSKPIIKQSLDIKPGSCPNPLNTNTRGKGRLPMAILGTETFDVSEIDKDSISINGMISPVLMPKIDDVGTPFEGEECNCHTVGADGYDDLVIHFSRQEVIAALGLAAMPPGSVVPITVQGELLDGTPFEATDCVRLVPRKD